MSIRIVDVDFADGLLWKPALDDLTAAGQRLVAVFVDEVKEAITSAGYATLSMALGVGHTLLGSAFGDEVSAIAEALDVSQREIILANMAYDLANSVGCSTFAAPADKGMIHARNLDWPFPGKLLSKHTTIFRTAGVPIGDYAMVGWPGLFGALTGLAPGRFSVTVNFVTHGDESTLGGAVSRAVNGYWPVSWLVRRALDECRDYRAAVRLLSNEPVLSSVLFMVAGPRKGEAVVIERGPDDYVHRAVSGRCVWVTNHYVSDANEDSNGDLTESDSVERFEFLDGAVPKMSGWTAQKALDTLSNNTLESDITQHQVIMFPATGEMVVALPDGTTEELTVEQRDLKVECPVDGTEIPLDDGPGDYECNVCGGTVTVDEDGVRHEEMLEVVCPADGKTVAVSSEDGIYECDCGGDIDVDGGEASHATAVEVRCPFDGKIYDYDEDGIYECPGCNATVTVDDDEGEHARISRVTCPSKGGQTAVETDEDADYECPFCRKTISVVDGRARHQRLT